LIDFCLQSNSLDLCEQCHYLYVLTLPVDFIVLYLRGSGITVALVL